MTKSLYIKIILVFASEVYNDTSQYGYLTCPIIEIYFQYILQMQYQYQVNDSEWLHNYCFYFSKKYSHFWVLSYNSNIILFKITKKFLKTL